MPILVVNGHRIYEQDEVGSDLSGYAFAVDKTGETEAEKIGAERIVLTGTELDGVNGYQAVTGKKYFNNRILFKRGVDIASANNIILPAGRFFCLSDATNELQTINNNGWTGGTDIILEIKPGQAIKHDAPDYGLGNYNGILLACEKDFIALQGLLLHLVYDNIEDKWKEINGTTIAAGGGSVEVLQYKFDHHTHIVTQAEAEGGDFTFEVPNVIAKNMGIHVYCNQLPLTLDKGYSIDLTSETSKEVTILKNNSDETYFSIKAGWPIFVGYYYKVAVPGTPENPPEPLSMVTLDSVTHQSPDNPAQEYNAANDVKFILTFSNTGSASESLNLRLQLVMSGTGGIIAEQDITHAVPTEGNTYEITYKALGITTGSQEYTLHVSGDRTGNNAVTVPAKTTTFASTISHATRNTTTTVLTTLSVKNTGSITGNKILYIQLDSGTKYPVNIYNLTSGWWANPTYEFTGVDGSAHTVNLYDSDQTTLLDVETIAEIAGTPVITTALNTYVKATGYTAAGQFKFNGDWAQSIDWNALELGVGGAYDDSINRSQVKILDVPNIASLSTVVLRFIPINGYEPNNANFAALQVHVHNKDLRYVQNYNDYHYSYINNNIVVSTQIIPDSDLGDTEYRVTLDGNYFENIADGYKGLLFKFTDETTPNTFTYLRLRQVQYIP